jgi:hypothetical protein
MIKAQNENAIYHGASRGSILREEIQDGCF